MTKFRVQIKKKFYLPERQNSKVRANDRPLELQKRRAAKFSEAEMAIFPVKITRFLLEYFCYLTTWTATRYFKHPSSYNVLKLRPFFNAHWLPHRIGFNEKYSMQRDGINQWVFHFRQLVKNLNYLNYRQKMFFLCTNIR